LEIIMGNKNEDTDPTVENEWTTFNMKMRPAMTRLLEAEAEVLGIPRSALIRIIVDRHLKSEN
jgi:hypothetical protein